MNAACSGGHAAFFLIARRRGYQTEVGVTASSTTHNSVGSDQRAPTTKYESDISGRLGGGMWHPKPLFAMALHPVVVHAGYNQLHRGIDYSLATVHGVVRLS